jgi:hypothetical protein
VDLSAVPPARLDALARYAILASAATIARMADERRAATLLAFTRAIETTAQDDALDLLDALIQELIRKARLTAQQTRLRTLKDLDAAALQLSTVCARLIDPTYADAEVRTAIYATIAPGQIANAIAQINALARRPDTTTQPELIVRYRMVRRFLPTLLRVLRCDGTAAGRPILKALAFLRRIEGERDRICARHPVRSCRGPGGALCSCRAARSIARPTRCVCWSNCKPPCDGTTCLSSRVTAGAICVRPCSRARRGRRSALTSAASSTTSRRL